VSRARGAPAQLVGKPVVPGVEWVVGPDRRTLCANQAVLAYTGLTLDEVMAADFRARVFHPDDVARLHDERQAALARGTPFANEQRVGRHDGQFRWFLIQYNPLQDDQGHLLRWYATGTDIDEREQAEERMRHNNLALRQGLAHASMVEETVESSAALRRVLALSRRRGMLGCARLTSNGVQSLPKANLKSR
jgi:PAS domain S-box-containing protein